MGSGKLTYAAYLVLLLVQNEKSRQLKVTRITIMTDELAL